MLYSDQSVLVFKPNAAELSITVAEHVFPLHQVAAGLLVAANLEVTEQVTGYQLDEVFKIYEKLLSPNPERDAIWGTAWKGEVVEHMVSGPIDAYFVRHPESGEAEKKAKGLKNFLRSHYCTGHEIVKNVAHVPDEDEFAVVRSILLKS
jgi:hypothetical protein